MSASTNWVATFDEALARVGRGPLRTHPEGGPSLKEQLRAHAAALTVDGELTMSVACARAADSLDLSEVAFALPVGDARRNKAHVLGHDAMRVALALATA